MNARKGSLLEFVAVPTPDKMVMELPKAVLPLPPSIVTAPPLVLPSPKDRVNILPLLVNDNPKTIDASPPAAPNELTAVTLNAPLMSVPEPTEIAMLPPEWDADQPLPISKVPLLPTLGVLVFNNRSPNMPAVPALLFNMATLPELVAVPTPDEMVMELPEAVPPSPPSIVTDPLLMLPSPKARVMLLPLLVDDNPKVIDASPPAAPHKSQAVKPNAPPMLVPEPTENAMLPSELDADKPYPIPKALLEL
jgi:hypothetical protein